MIRILDLTVCLIFGILLMVYGGGEDATEMVKFTGGFLIGYGGVGIIITLIAEYYRGY